MLVAIKEIKAEWAWKWSISLTLFILYTQASQIKTILEASVLLICPCSLVSDNIKVAVNLYIYPLKGYTEINKSSDISCICLSEDPFAWHPVCMAFVNFRRQGSDNHHIMHRGELNVIWDLSEGTGHPPLHTLIRKHAQLWLSFSGSGAPSGLPASIQEPCDSPMASFHLVVLETRERSLYYIIPPPQY